MEDILLKLAYRTLAKSFYQIGSLVNLPHYYEKLRIQTVIFHLWDILTLKSKEKKVIFPFGNSLYASK